jgi:hypothetical protein
MFADPRSRSRIRAVVQRCATPMILSAALLVACQQDAPTAPNGVARTGGAQSNLLGDDGSDVPSWVGNLLNGSTVLSADAQSTQEELPGLGHKFELLFGMMDDQDPQNLTNDVISVFTTETTIGVAVRNLPPGIKIAALDHQLNIKYFFPTRSCGGGSPRIQIAIDGDGDGKFNQFPGGPDQNAFGYVGHAPFGTGCITGEWDIIDMTDNIGRWDLSQFGGGMTFTWDQAQAFVTATFPNHRVISGSLVDDSGSFALTSRGQAYYDLVTIENRTLENDHDTVRR